MCSTDDNIVNDQYDFEPEVNQYLEGQSSTFEEKLETFDDIQEEDSILTDKVRRVTIKGVIYDN